MVSSVNGEAAIDGSNKRACRKLLGEIEVNADRLLELARQAQEGLLANSPERRAIVNAPDLPGELFVSELAARRDRRRC